MALFFCGAFKFTPTSGTSLTKLKLIIANRGNLFGPLSALEDSERPKGIFMFSTFNDYKNPVLCCHLPKHVAQTR